MIVKDFMKNEIVVGDWVVYPTQRGHCLYMNKARVENITDKGHVQVRKITRESPATVDLADRVSTIVRTDNIVIIVRGGAEIIDLAPFIEAEKGRAV